MNKEYDSQWMEQHYPKIAQWISEDSNPENTKDRIRDMILAEFPNTERPRSLAQVVLSRVRRMAENGKLDLSNVSTLHIHLNTTIVQPESKKRTKVKKTETLNFRFMWDDELTLNDRIIYSLIRKWYYTNQKLMERKQSTKPLSVYRFQQYTGPRKSSIKQAIQNLQERSYIDAQLNPMDPENDKRLKEGRYQKVKFKVGDDIGMIVFVAVMGNKPAGWAMKALGISEKTFYRWKAKAKQSQQETAKKP